MYDSIVKYKIIPRFPNVPNRDMPYNPHAITDLLIRCRVIPTFPQITITSSF